MGALRARLHTQPWAAAALWLAGASPAFGAEPSLGPFELRSGSGQHALQIGLAAQVRLTYSDSAAIGEAARMRDVSIEVRRADQALALPVSAVALQASPPFVLAVSADGVIERKPVRIIGRNPDWVAVLDLPEKVRVLRSQFGFAAGQVIRPVVQAAAVPDEGRPASGVARR